jgi:hypothetical protein
MLPLYQTLADATDQTTAVVAALVGTANRFATALKANNQAGVALQQTTTAILSIELADALSAQREAGVGLVNGLRALGLDLTLTRAQLQHLISALRHLRHFSGAPAAAAAAGITPATTAELLQSYLHKTSGNVVHLLAPLSAPVTTAALTARDAAVTPAAVQAIVDSLLAQNTISTSAANALGQALAGFSAATSVAETDQALSEFEATAKQVPGSAGAFLVAAERALAATA